jgi:two-component system, NtrC family, response regulator HydG
MSAELQFDSEPNGCEEALAKTRAFAFAAPPAARPKRANSRSANAHFGQLYGDSAAMQDVYRMIEKVAPTEASVLLIGESGTGKELAATAIHGQSSRAKGNFVAINCGGFSPNLIEAELFGYERGAFTGAVRAHRGCFERATGGTLFLDEITEMPIELQVKLLRALETGRFYRVGSEQEMQVDVRVVAATNRDPNQSVTQGLLREDLLYRLAVFPLPLPALRTREADVELLAGHFLDDLNAEAGATKTFSAAARGFLRQYAWPGNVRELKNAVQRAFILAEGEVNFDLPKSTANAGRPHLPVTTSGGGVNLQFAVGMPLDEIEREVIMATLAHCHGRKRETAELLGVSLKTLYNRLNEYRSREAGGPSSALAA